MPTKPVNTRSNGDLLNVTLCKLLCYLYTNWIQNGYKRKKIENEKEKKERSKEIKERVKRQK